MTTFAFVETLEKEIASYLNEYNTKAWAFKNERQPVAVPIFPVPTNADIKKVASLLNRLAKDPVPEGLEDTRHKVWQHLTGSVVPLLKGATDGRRVAQTVDQCIVKARQLIRSIAKGPVGGKMALKDYRIWNWLAGQEDPIDAAAVWERFCIMSVREHIRDLPGKIPIGVLVSDDANNVWGIVDRDLKRDGISSRLKESHDYWQAYRQKLIADRETPRNIDEAAAQIQRLDQLRLIVDRLADSAFYADLDLEKIGVGVDLSILPDIAAVLKDSSYGTIMQEAQAWANAGKFPKTKEAAAYYFLRRLMDTGTILPAAIRVLIGTGDQTFIKSNGKERTEGGKEFTFTTLQNRYRYDLPQEMQKRIPEKQSGKGETTPTTPRKNNYLPPDDF